MNKTWRDLPPEVREDALAMIKSEQLMWNPSEEWDLNSKKIARRRFESLGLAIEALAEIEAMK